MEQEYDEITAKHYSAYRPKLHMPILQKCLGYKNRFNFGLDIGCGTGHSSLALLNYCTHVSAIDTSNEMLSKANTHPKISYTHYDGENLSFEDGHFDIITLAGSLNYAKSQTLLNELIRVSKEGASIAIYDFMIDLEPILDHLGVEAINSTTEVYDYTIDFSGLQYPQLEKKLEKKDTLVMNLHLDDLSHLLLATKDIYRALLKKFDAQNLYDQLRAYLSKASHEKKYRLDVQLFYAVYQLKRDERNR